jgi:hypothetical protein
VFIHKHRFHRRDAKNAENLQIKNNDRCAIRLTCVDLATSMPSLSGYPTIRGEPQPTLAADILRINALISSDTGGPPTLPCLLNLAQ